MKKHYKSRGFYIYGRNTIKEALLRSPEKISEIFFASASATSSKPHAQSTGSGAKADEIGEIADLAKHHQIRLTSVDQTKLSHLVGDVKSQGVAAHYKSFTYASFKDVMEKISDKQRALILVLDGVEDVQNFGAIIRSAVAVGADAVMVSDYHQAPVNGGVFATSAGTASQIDIVQFSGMGQLIEDLKANEFWLYGVDMATKSDGRALTEHEQATHGLWKQTFDDRTALILGGEGKGISQKAHEKCDFYAPIPMENGVESLNVSVAAAVAMYEWKRQQD